MSKLLTLASALSLLAFAPSADKLSFHPADGSELSKTFQVEGEFDLGDVSMMLDGQDMSQMLGAAEASGDFAMALAIVDHYVKVEEGRPLELVRDIESSSSEFNAGENSESKEDVFELDGKSIVYKWNAETKKYDRSYKEGEGDQDKLDGLGPDLDYRALLPERAVAEGDQWEVQPKALMSALMFGADLDSLAEKGADEPELQEVFDQILPEIEKLFDAFKAQCTYTGTRDVEGTQVGEIKIKINSEGTADLANVLLDVIKKQTEGQNVALDLQDASLSVKMRGEGTLLWNVAAGRPHSFDLGSDVTLNFSIDMSVDAEGQKHSVDGSAELTGKVKWTMETSGK